MKNIHPKQYLQNPQEYTLLDVRSQDEWDKYHDRRAIHVPLIEIGQGGREIPKEKPIAVICHTGGRSMRGCAILETLGFEAYNVAGGMRMFIREQVIFGELGANEAEKLLEML